MGGYTIGIFKIVHANFKTPNGKIILPQMTQIITVFFLCKSVSSVSNSLLLLFETFAPPRPSLSRWGTPPHT